ncbi:Shedu immune nuclease family protein [Sutcliffiella halmapala]
MSIFKKAYELINNAPQALDWDTYEKVVVEEYEQLLKQNGNEERVFQDFFERNPAFLPGAFGVYGESGHSPYNNALIIQPLLQGLTSKIPDFLWIASDSLNIYPIFIEIETHNKRWFRKNGVPTAEFTQAQNQLSDWKTWLSNPTHQNLFYQYYDIDKEIVSGKSVRPQYILIYGSRNEFIEKPELNQKRAQLVRENETYMTFDRLSPNIKARNTVTCKVSNRKYTAKFISPTFRLGPVYAEELSKIDNKIEAINNSKIDKKRKEFLISRLEYWEEFGRKQPRGLRNSGDWE